MRDETETASLQDWKIFTVPFRKTLRFFSSMENQLIDGSSASVLLNAGSDATPRVSDGEWY
jgi:hypothetical protein